LSVGGDLQYDSTTGLISFTDAVTSVNTQVGDVVLNTDNVAEGDTNKYFTEERSRQALSTSGNAIQYNSEEGIFSVDILTPTLPLLALKKEGYQTSDESTDFIDFQSSDILIDNMESWNVVGKVYNVLVSGNYDVQLSLTPQEFSQNYKLVLLKNGLQTGLEISVNMEGGSVYGSISSHNTLSLNSSDQLSLRIITDRSLFTFSLTIPAISFSLKMIPSNLVKPITGVGLSPVISVNGLDGEVLLNTSSIPEGTNSYFTQERARQSFSSGFGVDVNTITGTISQKKNITRIHYDGPGILYEPSSDFLGPDLEDISHLFDLSFDIDETGLWNDVSKRFVIPVSGYYRFTGSMNTSPVSLVLIDMGNTESSNLPLPTNSGFNDILHLTQGMSIGIFYVRQTSETSIELFTRADDFPFSGVRSTNHITIERLT
jgi:hypothetical protein